METFLNLLIFILSLGLLITIHELGHFATAKLFKVYVKEFSLGFGPLLFKKKKGETQYSIRALPLGGYVMMVGEDATSDDELKDIPKERTLGGIAKWKRAIIMSAGIILNFVLAFLLFFVSNAAFEQKSITNRVNVTSGSPGASALVVDNEAIDITYLQEATIPVLVNGTETYFLKYRGFSSYNADLVDIVEISRNESGEKVYYTPTTDTDILTFQIQIRHLNEDETVDSRLIDLTLHTVLSDNKAVIEKSGLTFQVHRYRYTFGESIVESGKNWWNGFTTISKSLGDIFQGKNLDQVGGIVAVFKTTSTVLNEIGFVVYIQLWGLISVNLALFNLLPFPGLDGWHLLVVIIEGVTRKEIPSKLKNILSAIGFLLLMGLMIILLAKDLFFISLL